MKASVLTVFLFVSTTVSSVLAGPAGPYLDAGREALFNGTLTGLRNANAIFEQGMKDPACIECSNDRELIFFHALSRILQWAVGDDGLPVDSALELARDRGFTITGDRISELTVQAPTLQKNRFDRYELPDNLMEILEGVVAFLDASALPEIRDVRAELDRIGETPENRFCVFLTPEELQVFYYPNSSPSPYNLEVDYSDVLILKGLLAGIEAIITARSAYDLTIDAEDRLLEKFHGDCFEIQHDLLLPHPDFLKVLPTVNDPGNGKAILQAARQGWIAALDSYLAAIANMLAENEDGTDPQDDELLFIGYLERPVVEAFNSHIRTVRDSLVNETPVILDIPVEMTYRIFGTKPTVIGTLRMEYDTLGNPTGGTLELHEAGESSMWWTIDGITIEQGLLQVYVEDHWIGLMGLFGGILNPTQSRIENAFFDYWGVISGSVRGLTAQRQDLQVETYQGDLNPIFGGTAEYPDPVSPRDLLPDWDLWNHPLPGTMGLGLGSDPTLGGIVPGIDQEFWQTKLNLQPSGILDWREVYPWQKADGWVLFWLDEQKVLHDPQGDAGDMPGLDIRDFYLGYDDDFLYGAIDLYDSIGEGIYTYTLTLSYCPGKVTVPGTIRFQMGGNDLGSPGGIGVDTERDILINNALPYGTTEFFVQDQNWDWWERIPEGDFEVLSYGDLLLFRIPIWQLPMSLNGRYLSLSSQGNPWNLIDPAESGETNQTQIRLGLAGSIQGQVNYPSFTGSPIYVQAYCDPRDPEGSLVSRTMLTAPGPYRLDGIGLGWSGYVRAFTPLFGFNPLGLDTLHVETRTSINMISTTLGGINLNLRDPELLQSGAIVNGKLLTECEDTIYAFDEIQGGEYEFLLLCGNGACTMELLDRDGGSMSEAFYISPGCAVTGRWPCSVSGRYYLRVSPGPSTDYPITYEIHFNTDPVCPWTDISGPEWSGVGDCRVDLSDFALLAKYWLDQPYQPMWGEKADLTQDYKVNLSDLSILAEEWLTFSLRTVKQPIIYPWGGTFSMPQEVYLYCETEGADIYYTTDGTEPTEQSTLYLSAFTLDKACPVKARAFKAGYAESPIASAAFVFRVAEARIIPSGGFFDQPQQITLSCDTEGATIYLTTNGEEPTDQSTLYTEPFILNSSCIIRTRAFKAGWLDSEIRTGNFTFYIQLWDALDNPGLSFETGGTQMWFGQWAISQDGSDAAQSGAVLDNRDSWLGTTVVGPGTLSFYWKVSSEENADFLRFTLDGAEQIEAISGEVDWTPASIQIYSGTHIVKWVYGKNGEFSSGSDCGWLDQVVWQSDSVPLTVNGATETGTIPFAGAYNWYRFTVSAAGFYRIETWEGTLYDIYMYLYGPNNQTMLIEEDDDDGLGYASMIERWLEPGTYFVKIRAYSNDSTGSYTIKVTH